MIRLLFIMLVGCGAVKARCAYDINFIIHNIEGKVYTDPSGEIRGIPHSGRRAFNLELVREMMKRQNHPVVFLEMPFKRGLRYVQTKHDYALFNISRNPDRENTVKWVGPLQTDYVYFYELKESPTGIETLSDIGDSHSVCVIIGSRHHEILKELGVANVHLNTSYENCFRMLLKKRVELTPISHFDIGPMMDQIGGAADLIRQTPVLLYKSEGYIIFSKNIPDSIVRQWQDALDHMKKSGKYEQLRQKYLLHK